MSEHVESHLESMSAEFMEMKRIRLFSSDEIRLILKTRKQHEYKINGVTKKLEDFMNYIMYEKAVLRDIRIRRNKLRIVDKKGAIEYSITKRIKHLYEIAIQNYSNDFPLCLSYFKFCKEANFHQRASLIIQSITKRFTHIPETWQVAASWYLKNDLNQALNMIHKGITHHKDNQDLYCEAIQLELHNRDKNNSNEGSQFQQPTASDVNSCKKISTYVDAACEHINDYNFLLKILSILEKHPFTKEVQVSIVARLLEKHSGEENVWNALAQREYRGHHYKVPPELSKCNSHKFRLKRCLDKYEEGIAVMEKEHPTKVDLLWGICLDWLVDKYQCQRQGNVVNQTYVLDMFEKASKSSILEEKYYIIWAKLLDDEKKVLEVIENGLKESPTSLELWKLRLKYSAMKNDVKEFNNCFKEGVKRVKEKSAPLWVAALRFHSLNSNVEIVEAIFKKAVEQPNEVSGVLKPEYIEWLTLHWGINEARNMYLKLARQQPYCKELHNVMAKIENIEIDIDLKRLENVYKLACEQFGHEDCDVWVNQVEFYYKHRDGLIQLNSNFDISESVLAVYKEAAKKLEGQGFLWADFTEKFKRISE
ncbi:unnamed protein product [Acanthoscelides obtectus]|uniref:U3 small nucleolar RNA-associated protein 6 n=1 Tax=Acanthoscelides obtectus TaxID=200917 RepID=A0A9P0K0U5_ACAOB|nr:unnamed protein product [Acanthoscelides obtectus]CAK1654004.1 U3 small nucleolar RNA-associated protein 6 homolog [Acanthoscelides obtectus]